MANPAGIFDRVLARVGKQVVRCVELHGEILVHARSIVRCAPCPDRRSWSRRRHASYTRRLAERPVLDKPIEFQIEIHRFKCSTIGCPRRTFAEDIHRLAGRHQRRTRSHTRALTALGYALGGAAAARLATELGLKTSADTLIRQLRRSAEIERERRPRIVGIDDWAIAKGHHYGTLIVDLERREPIDVLVGREATAVEAWLRDHPSIEIIARDRAGAYAEAAALALPGATQVSDRWHLLSNLRDNVERMLQRLGPQMRRAAQQVVLSSTTPGRQGIPGGTELYAWQRLSDHRRAARLALYEKAVALHGRGMPKTMDVRWGSTSARYASSWSAGTFQNVLVALQGQHLWMPTGDSLRGGSRRAVGRQSSCGEKRQRGYSGSRAALQHCVARLLSPQVQTSLVSTSVRTMPCPSARRAFGWIVGWSKMAVDEPKHANHQRFVQAFCRIEPVVAEVRSLAREFLGLMHRRRPREFDRWLKRLSRCSAPEMRSFAKSLQHDLAAVRAAFMLPWSNGQTEGHVNRLKFLKRQMYGRASVELLRIRVLGPN